MAAMLTRTCIVNAVDVGSRSDLELSPALDGALRPETCETFKSYTTCHISLDVAMN